MIYYLPGCDVEKNHPAAVAKLRSYIKDKGVTIAECCRKDLDFLRKEDTVITNCTLCDLMLGERTSDIEKVSLYEWLLDDKDFPWKSYKGMRLTVQDCFRTRNDRSLQEAVRKCLRRMQAEVVEVVENYAETTFCGVWLNNPAAPDCSPLAPKTFAWLERYRHILPPDEQKARMESWVAQYETDEIAVYCNGCENGIRLGGGHPVHMVELLAVGL